jgi:hypothetical protein
MAVDAPVIVVMTSPAVILIVIELTPMFYYPAWVVMFNPPVFVIERHAILFDVFVANIACNLVFPSFFVARDAVTEHVRDKVRGNCITLLNARMTLITLNFIFKMRLMGKF